MKMIKMSMTAVMSMAAVMLAGIGSHATAGDIPKVTLKADRTLVFNQLPPSIDDFSKILSKGIFYGRLRINTFKFNWGKEYSSTKDNWAAGFGGSLIYKSARYKGISGTAALYTSQNPWHVDAEDVQYGKAGKDVYSRNDIRNGGHFSMSALAQVYLDYQYSETTFRVGRQIFESFLTKSNDTKMIPNTFEGVTVHSKELKDTSIKLAYLTAQKLRDHTSFHDVITFKDAADNSWANNDDSAVNKALSYADFVAAGEDPDHNLIVIEAANKSIKNLKLQLNYTAVPNVVSSLTGDAYYTIKIGNSVKVIPGVRYMTQFDDLSGKIANVANLKDNPTGYSDPNSMDSRLFAGKVDIKSENAWKLRFGYSQVADKADIVAPWRGFPTGGFTRAMAQYNWYANTKTYLVRADYNFEKAGLIPGLTGMVRYAIQNFDDTKKGVQADSNILNIDAIQKFKSMPGLEARVRIAFVSGDAQTGAVTKNDPSYNEYRFELNYLF